MILTITDSINNVLMSMLKFSEMQKKLLFAFLVEIFESSDFIHSIVVNVSSIIV